MGKRSREKQKGRLEAQASSEAITRRHSKFEKFYLIVIELGIYLTLFTPLVFVKDYFFPFVSPKTIFFRIIVDIIFIAYVLLVVSSRRYLPKFNILTISITVFLGITILTSITGINFERSFWSTFERMTGLLTFFHLYVFFIILTSVFKERKYWERILTVSIIVGVLICLFTLTSDDLSTRGGGTLGNISFLAAYLLFNIFFAIILFFTKKGAWKILYGAALVTMFLPLFLSPELPRGGIGAFFIGIFLLGLGYMIFSGKRLLKRLAPVMFLLIVLTGVGIIQSDFFKQKMFNITELPGAAREIVWQMGFDGWKEKFLLGWGPENFNIAFAKHFDPRLPLTGDVWYDRVHNVVLDTAVHSGILGILSYLTIFGVAIVGLLKLCPKVIEKRNLFLPLGMVALLVGYFIQNIFVFDMISSYMIFFLSLAFIAFLISPKEESFQPTYLMKKNSLLPFLGALLIIITIITIYFGNIQPARASRYIIQGIVSNLENSIPAFQKAIQTSPMSIFETPEQFSRKMTGFTFDQSQNKDILGNGFESAAEEMQKAIDKSPQDFRYYLLLGRHYNDFFQLTQDQEKLSLAEKYLEKAIELSPENQQVYWSFAQTKIFQGKAGEAISLMQQSVDLDPYFGRSHWFLAMAYRIVGNYEMALEEIKKAEEVGYNWKANSSELKTVIDVYQKLQDSESLVELYLLAMNLEPQNAQFYAGLAVAYANLGQFDMAREVAQKAIELNPEYAEELESFLSELPH